MPTSKEEKPLNIHQKVIEIRKSVTSLPKNKKGFKGEYADGASVLFAVRSKMDELGVLLNVEVVEQKKEQTLVKVWNDNLNSMVEKIEWIIDLRINYTWINAENPGDFFSIPFPAFGQSSNPSYAMGIALTFSERYFFFKQLQIPTDEMDPDKPENGGDVTTIKHEMHTCPLCHEKKAMISKYPDKGKYYCNACKQNFQSLTGESEPKQPATQPPDEPKNGKETLLDTLKKLAGNKELFNQIEEKHRGNIEKIMQKNDPVDVRISGWIDFLTKNYARLAVKDQKISPEQIQHIWVIADREGYKKDYVHQIIKAEPYCYDSTKDILVKDYQNILHEFKVPSGAENVA